MNWDALAAIAELLGAIGVLTSLIYLAVQIRQNTVWLRQQAFQLSTNEVRQWASRFSGSRGNSELFLKGQHDFGSLDPTERFQFTMMIFEICSVWATYQEHGGEDLLGLRDSANSTIGAWIDQGAEYQSHWAFSPQEHPRCPGCRRRGRAASQPQARFGLSRLRESARGGA